MLKGDLKVKFCLSDSYMTILLLYFGVFVGEMFCFSEGEKSKDISPPFYKKEITES